MKIKTVILVVILFTLLVAGCGVKACNTANPGEEFSLSIGQGAAIKGENLKVTFVQVLEDSRCPKGVQCIQAGRARSLVSIVSSNTTEIELIEPGLTDQTNRQTFRDYQIGFHLLPYPEAGKVITTAQYRLQMTISKLK